MSIIRKIGGLSDKILSPIIYFIIGALLSPIILRFIGKGYSQFIQKLPFWILSIILLIILILIGIVILLKRRSSIKKSNLDRKVPDFSIPSPFGEETIGYIKHKDVIWEVTIPKEMPSYNPFFEAYKKGQLLKLDPDRIKVDYCPHCPDCLDLLEESDTFFGSHLWKCKKCDFQKKNKHSYSYEMKKATLIARQEFEKYKSGSISENLTLKKEYLNLFMK